MADVSHTFGADIDLSASGDLAVVSGTEEGRQRVLRRLLTNPGDLLFQPTYGAGLGRFVGLPANAAQITGVVLQQMQFEAVVAQDPEPSVAVTVGQDGTVGLSIAYTDAATGQRVPLAFDVGQNSTAIQG